MRNFKVLREYNPNEPDTDKLGEWNISYYSGCSNKCTYCYVKICNEELWNRSDDPVLNPIFEDEEDAINALKSDLLSLTKEELLDIQKRGVTFSFFTDPLLEETKSLTMKASNLLLSKNIPVKILTKTANFDSKEISFPIHLRHKVAFGFSITDEDKKEPGASPSQDRILQLIKLHNEGYLTFVNIEPIFKFKKAIEIFKKVFPYTDIIRLGTFNNTTPKDMSDEEFVNELIKISNDYSTENNIPPIALPKVYLKFNLYHFLFKEENKLVYVKTGKGYNYGTIKSKTPYNFHIKKDFNIFSLYALEDFINIQNRPIKESKKVNLLDDMDAILGHIRSLFKLTNEDRLLICGGMSRYLREDRSTYNDIDLLLCTDRYQDLLNIINEDIPDVRLTSSTKTILENKIKGVPNNTNHLFKLDIYLTRYRVLNNDYYEYCINIAPSSEIKNGVSIIYNDVMGNTYPQVSIDKKVFSKRDKITIDIFLGDKDERSEEVSFQIDSKNGDTDIYTFDCVTQEHSEESSNSRMILVKEARKKAMRDVRQKSKKKK